MTLFPTAIIDLDERNQVLHFSAYISLVWTDARLGWVPGNHGNITQVFLQQSDVWVPTLQLRNSVVDWKSFGTNDNLLTLFQDGTRPNDVRVFLNVKVVDKIRCDIDVSYYPFDVQTCYFVFDFVPMTSDDIHMYHESSFPPLYLSYMDEDGTWELIHTDCMHKYTYIPGWNVPNYDIVYSLVLRRRSSFHVLNIILPLVFVSMTASAVFLLPADAGKQF